MLKTIFTIAFLMVIGIATTAAQSQTSSKASANGSNRSSVNKGEKELISSGTVVNAALMNSVDVRKSKVGDEVILKTTKAIKTNGETTVAKGATLVGRITEIQQRTKENAQSRITMLFERIEGKDLSAPVSVSILSMTGLKASGGNSDTFADTGLMSSSSASSSPSSGSGGGGLLGGVGNTVGGLVNATTQTAGNVVGGVTNTAGNTVGAVTSTVNGIQISHSLSGSASGSTSFSSQNKNLRIDKGASFNLQFNSSVQN
jgi:hypothetical protein